MNHLHEQASGAFTGLENRQVTRATWPHFFTKALENKGFAALHTARLHDSSQSATLNMLKQAVCSQTSHFCERSQPPMVVRGSMCFVRMSRADLDTPKRMTQTPFFEGAMPHRRTRGLWSSPKRSRFRAPWRVSTKHCRSLLLRSNSRPERVYILRSKSSVSPFLAKLSARPMILELDTLAILIPMRLG